MTAVDRGVDQDVMRALGIAGAEVITYDAWAALPDHRRHVLAGPGSRRSVYLRLPDPPPVAALRRIAELADTADGAFAAEAQRIAESALADFDGTASDA